MAMLVSAKGETGTGCRLVFSTLAGMSKVSTQRLLGTQHLLQARVDVGAVDIFEILVSLGEGNS